MSTPWHLLWHLLWSARRHAAKRRSHAIHLGHSLSWGFMFRMDKDDDDDDDDDDDGGGGDDDDDDDMMV